MTEIPLRPSFWILRFLIQWKPILPRKKWLFQEIPEDVINIVAMSKWARGIAEGQARIAGLTPGTPAWEEFVKGYSKEIARRFLAGVKITKPTA